MPTISHEAPILLFRESPELVPRLLQEAAGVAIPPHDGLRVEESNFAQIAPSEHRADLVLTLAAGRKPVMGIVVEVQLDPVARNRFTWPLYVAALHARLACPTCLVVVTADAEAARWAAKSITTLQLTWRRSRGGSARCDGDLGGRGLRERSLKGSSSQSGEAGRIDARQTLMYLRGAALPSPRTREYRGRRALSLQSSSTLVSIASDWSWT